MTQYKIYTKGNYIVVVDVQKNEYFYGTKKEVFIDKSNTDKGSYRAFNIKDFNEDIVLSVPNILKEDSSAYSESEFDTFYQENTGNFNGGGAAPLIREEFTYIGGSQIFTLIDNYSQIYVIEVQGQGALSSSQYVLTSENSFEILDALEINDYIVVVYSVSVSGTIPYYTQGQIDSFLALKQNTISNPVTGTGTSNKLARFIGSSQIGDSSQIYDNGSNIGIGAESTGARFEVRAQSALSSDVAFRVRNSTNTLDFFKVTADGNVRIGTGAARFATGAENTANGSLCLYSLGVGAGNTGQGANALQLNVLGSNNTAQGLASLLNCTSSSNTAQGSYALSNITSVSGNTAQGSNSARYLADGVTALTSASNSVFLGFDTRANANAQSNQIVIGAQAIGEGSNSVVLGNSSILRTRLRGQIIIGTFASAPTGIEGAIYYDSVTKKHYGFDGTIWNALY